MLASMPKSFMADDILPLVAALTPAERVRLLHLMSRPQGADEAVYGSLPPGLDEFSTDEESLAWEAEGWEDVARSAGTRFALPISDGPFWCSRATRCSLLETRWSEVRRALLIACGFVKDRAARSDRETTA